MANDPTLVQCHSCRHTVHFSSDAAASRFLRSSSWVAHLKGLSCPVCHDGKSFCKTPHEPTPAEEFAAQYAAKRSRVLQALR